MSVKVDLDWQVFTDLCSKSLGITIISFVSIQGASTDIVFSLNSLLFYDEM